MKKIFAAAVLAVSTLTFVGCASKHEEGVKSNLLTQWIDVNADTVRTADAAKAVLEAEGLQNVTGSSTKLDGKVHGKLSDGTDVNVTIAKKKDVGSEVSVKVGMTGDRAMGAELAKKIKAKAEAGAVAPTGT